MTLACQTMKLWEKDKKELVYNFYQKTQFGFMLGQSTIEGGNLSALLNN